MVTKTYTSAKKLTEDTWKYSSQKQKRELLNATGNDESFAETKTIQELVKRGGGFVAKDLLRLNEELLRKRRGKVTITWR